MRGKRKMDQKPQGTLANISGNVLEKTVKEVFLTKGFVLAKYSQWKKDPVRFGEELLLTQAPYRTIYDHPGKTEFLALSRKYRLKARIECKWQQSAGSVDEKLPYLYLNCIEAMPEDTIIIIIDGGGFKKGAVYWLQEAVRANKYTAPGCSKDIHVFSLSDFIVWANKILR